MSNSFLLFLCLSSKIEEQLQLYLNFLGPNVIMLRSIGTSDNSKKLEYRSCRSTIQFYQQKSSLKKKVK
jgi:hypothetical protein